MLMQIIIDRFLRSEKSKSLKLKPLDKLLMFFLASYMGKKKSCFPSYDTLLKDLGISKRQSLNNSIKKLEKLNLLFVERKEGESNIYSFNLLLLPGTKGNWGSSQREREVGTKGNSNNISNNINNKRANIKF